MNLEQLYNQVQDQINRVNFDLLWSGFKPTSFALYTENECYYKGKYIEKTPQFMANTAILFEGEIIAIWNVTSTPENIYKFTASIIHEMFHVFQIMQRETRYADEKAALFKYQYHLENYSLKLQEAQLIRAIIEDYNLSLWHTLLSLRKVRYKKFPYEFDYESRIEQIEGSAHYVELKALEQLDELATESQWKNLVEKINQPSLYFPIRIISYSIGALLLKCIDMDSTFDYMKESNTPFSIEILKDVDFEEKNVSNHSEFQKYFDQYFIETQSIIDKALSKNDVALLGEYPLVSLNIYDARFLNGYATSSYFVAYQDKDEMKVMHGNFVVELDKELNILTVYRQ
jgi:hypothetical protein